MNIALDYDNTYTRQPEMWDSFIRIFKAHQPNNKIYCVSSRSTSQAFEVLAALSTKVDGCYFTDCVAKEKFMFAQGISIDVCGSMTALT